MTKAREKTFTRIMKKFVAGKLKSGDKPVTTKKRAVQIAMHKARNINA